MAQNDPFNLSANDPFKLNQAPPTPVIPTTGIADIPGTVERQAVTAATPPINPDKFVNRWLAALNVTDQEVVKRQTQLARRFVNAIPANVLEAGMQKWGPSLIKATPDGTFDQSVFHWALAHNLGAKGPGTFGAGHIKQIGAAARNIMSGPGALNSEELADASAYLMSSASIGRDGSAIAHHDGSRLVANDGMDPAGTKAYLRQAAGISRFASHLTRKKGTDALNDFHKATAGEFSNMSIKQQGIFVKQFNQVMNMGWDAESLVNLSSQASQQARSTGLSGMTGTMIALRAAALSGTVPAEYRQERFQQVERRLWAAQQSNYGVRTATAMMAVMSKARASGIETAGMSPAQVAAILERKAGAKSRSLSKYLSDVETGNLKYIPEAGDMQGMLDGIGASGYTASDARKAASSDVGQEMLARWGHSESAMRAGTLEIAKRVNIGLAGRLQGTIRDQDQLTKTLGRINNAFVEGKFTGDLAKDTNMMQQIIGGSREVAESAVGSMHGTMQSNPAIKELGGMKEVFSMARDEGRRKAQMRFSRDVAGLTEHLSKTFATPGDEWAPFIKALASGTEADLATPLFKVVGREQAGLISEYVHTAREAADITKPPADLAKLRLRLAELLGEMNPANVKSSSVAEASGNETADGTGGEAQDAPSASPETTKEAAVDMTQEGLTWHQGGVENVQGGLIDGITGGYSGRDSRQTQITRAGVA